MKNSKWFLIEFAVALVLGCLIAQKLYEGQHYVLAVAALYLALRPMLKINQ